MNFKKVGHRSLPTFIDRELICRSTTISIGGAAVDGSGRRLASMKGDRADARVCAAYRCQEPARLGGALCGTHQCRLDQGQGLPKWGDILPGDPSGYGNYGELWLTDLGYLCHECGEWFVSVGIHLQRHGLSAAEYRRKHGLRPGQSLRAPVQTPRGPRRSPCPRCGRTYTIHHRICTGCRAITDAAKVPRNRGLTVDEASQLTNATREQLDDLIPLLQAAGVESRVIAATVGRSQHWVSTHYPRRHARAIRQARLDEIRSQSAK